MDRKQTIIHIVHSHVFTPLYARLWLILAGTRCSVPWAPLTLSGLDDIHVYGGNLDCDPIRGMDRPL